MGREIKGLPGRVGSNEHGPFDSLGKKLHSCHADAGPKTERKQIAKILSDRFDLHEDDVGQLLFRAEKMQDDAIDLYGFTNVITRNADHEERLEVVYHIWHVILADHHIDKFEDHLIRKICHILGVHQHDSIAQRDRVLQEIEGK